MLSYRSQRLCVTSTVGLMSSGGDISSSHKLTVLVGSCHSASGGLGLGGECICVALTGGRLAKWLAKDMRRYRAFHCCSRGLWAAHCYVWLPLLLPCLMAAGRSPIPLLQIWRASGGVKSFTVLKAARRLLKKWVSVFHLVFILHPKAHPDWHLWSVFAVERGGGERLITGQSWGVSFPLALMKKESLWNRV